MCLNVSSLLWETKMWRLKDNIANWRVQHKLLIEAVVTKRRSKPGAVVSAYNISTLGGWGRRITSGQEFDTSLGSIMRPCLYKNKAKEPSVVVHTCSPSTQESEVGGWLVAKMTRLQWAMILSLHSSFSDRARPCLNNKKFAYRRMKGTEINVYI